MWASSTGNSGIKLNSYSIDYCIVCIYKCIKILPCKINGKPRNPTPSKFFLVMTLRSPQIQYSSISLARRRTWPSISTAREWRRYWEGQCSTVILRVVNLPVRCFWCLRCLQRKLIVDWRTWIDWWRHLPRHDVHLISATEATPVEY